MIDLSIVDDSPLRCIDPRVKLAASVLFCGFAVPLSGWGLYILLAATLAGLASARLLRSSLRLLRRLALAIVLLFILQALLKDIGFAVDMACRILVASLSFCFLLFSTTPEELAVALRKIGLSARWAHSAVLMVEQAPLILAEFVQIRETYRQRFGRCDSSGGLISRVRSVLRMARRIMAPAIVMSIHRAWAMSEAAYARGFESPNPTIFRDGRLGWRDWLFVLCVAAVIAAAWQVR